MSSLNAKYVTLRLGNLAPHISDKVVDVESVRPRYKIDPDTKKSTGEIDGFNLDFFGVKGGVQTVKLPMDVKDQIAKIDEALKTGSIVHVNFGTPSTFKARFYAMLNNGSLIQGITATASTLEIISIDTPELEDFDDIQI